MKIKNSYKLKINLRTHYTLLVIFSMIGSFLKAQTIPGDGLIVWLPLNGTIEDISINNNRVFYIDNNQPRILDGPYNFISDRFGRLNSALQLNTLNENNAIKIRLPQTLSLRDRTVALWIKSPSQSFKMYSNIFELGISNEVKQYCSILGDESSYVLQKRVGKISCLVAEGGYVESRTYLNDGNWHHLAVVVSSSERRYKIYVDGQLDSDTHLQVPITNSLNPYSISQQKPILEIPVNYLAFGNVWKNEPESAFGGTLDDIGVWSKALSDSEISQLFNSFYTSNSRPNVRIDDRIKSISSNLNTNYTSSFNPKTVKSLNSDTSLNFFNPNTDIYINSREAAEYPDFKNSYACFGRFKNSGIRNDYYFGREIVNRVISYFNSLGYNNLLTLGQTIKAGDASGLNGYYTYVEFKEMNPIIMKKLMILLFSLGNGEQQIPYSKSAFALDMCTYGYINNDGKIIVKPEYDYVGEFSEGLALVSKINASGINKSGFVDETGKLVVPLIYESTSNAFSDGVCWVQGKGGKYGYIDKSGKLIIPLQYDQAQDFKNGIAEIRKGEIWSKIDKRGMPTVGKNKFPNSKLRELSVQGNSLDNKINKLFEDMYNEINAKTLFFGKSASSQKTIALETLKIRKIVEDWLGGPMTSSQLLEFNQISKRVAGVSNLIMSAVSNSLSSSSSSARPGYGEQIGSQNRNASSSSSNVTSDQKCGMCTPSDSRGYSLRDYSISSRTYSNFRYVKRPGYKLCQSCWGTGLQSQTGPNVCNQCKGERFIKCNYCRGTGKKS